MTSTAGCVGLNLTFAINSVVLYFYEPSKKKSKLLALNQERNSFYEAVKKTINSKQNKIIESAILVL